LTRLHEAVTWARAPAVEALNSMMQRFFDFGTDAQLMAIKQLNTLAHRQGVVMAFADVFLALTVLFVGLAFLALVLKRPVQSIAGSH
jgi:DHA2 family multidrug resistance protein